MQQQAFKRLAPFIREYIYKAKWQALRPIQLETITTVFDSDVHILITSGTASGKTEAAFLPIITALHDEPPQSIGALYIGPLKALINDQFTRLNDLLAHSDISVQSWHGDISSHRKLKFIRNARGILQITPESLEAMLMRRTHHLAELFGDLRFVVIDEIHALIGNDRGRQILCHLQRLARFQKQLPRRIGLSATIGDPSSAAAWLASGTEVACQIVKDDRKNRMQIGLEYFQPDDGQVTYQESAEEIETTVERDGEEDFEKHLYKTVDGCTKTLVFVNSRGNGEETVAALRRQASLRNAPDYFHIHHGNISKELREHVEKQMRVSDQRACTVATMTMELGIDIGYLDQVIQIDATASVASFLQRLGRSGRRDGISRMFIYTRDTVNDQATVLKALPWKMLQMIAIIELYRRDRWIEPSETRQFPVSLLYQQTMSTLFSATSLSPEVLRRRVLAMPPFASVSQSQFNAMLEHLQTIEHLELHGDRTLSIGIKAEKLVNHYSFYATFEADEGYRVRNGAREIGQVPAYVPPGETLTLAGFAWRVERVEGKSIFVERLQGRAKKPSWSGGKLAVHQRIVEMVHQILRETETYPYLKHHAATLLEGARRQTQLIGIEEHKLLLTNTEHLILFPAVGSKTFTTLSLQLQGCLVDALDPYFMILSCPGDVEQVLNTIPSVAQTVKNLPREAVLRDKFDRFMPDSLVVAAFLADHLDETGADQVLQKIR